MLQLDVVVERALGAEVPLGGDARLQRRPGMGHRLGHAEADRFPQHLGVPQGLVVGMEKQMRVALDEAGDERRPGERDPLGAGGHADWSAGPTAAMRAPRTRTTHPRATLSETPSQTPPGTMTAT